MKNVWEEILKFLTKEKKVVVIAEYYDHTKNLLVTTLKNKRAYIALEDISIYPQQNNGFYVHKLIGKKIKAIHKGWDDEGNTILSRADYMKNRINKNSIYSDVEGVVVSASDKALFVEFDEGLSGIIYMNQLTSAKLGRPTDLFEIGSNIKAKIVKFKEDTNYFELSRLECYKDVPFKNKVGDKIQCTITKKLDDNTGFFVEVKKNPNISGIFDVLNPYEFKIGSEITLGIHKRSDSKLRLRV